jgi:hypothetical protein
VRKVRTTAINRFSSRRYWRRTLTLRRTANGLTRVMRLPRRPLRGSGQSLVFTACLQRSRDDGWGRQRRSRFDCVWPEMCSADVVKFAGECGDRLQQAAARSGRAEPRGEPQP